MFKNLSIGLLILVTFISLIFTLSLNTKSYSYNTIVANAQNTDQKPETTKRYNKLLAFDFYKTNFKPVIKESVIKLNNYNVEKKRQEEERVRKELEEKAKQEAEEKSRIAEEARQKQLEVQKQAQAIRAEEARQKQIQQAAQAQQSQSNEAATAPTIFSGDIKGYAQSQVCAKWGCDHWSAFDFIVYKESTWDINAKNPSSGALGLCQNNPYSRAISDDYRKNGNAQVDWCINYISGRYGNPISAKAFWLSRNWF